MKNVVGRGRFVLFLCQFGYTCGCVVKYVVLGITAGRVSYKGATARCGSRVGDAAMTVAFYERGAPRRGRAC